MRDLRVSKQGCISLPGRLTRAARHPARDTHRDGDVVPRAAGVCRTRRLARAATTRVRSSVERHRRAFLVGRRLLPTGSVWILWAAGLLLAFECLARVLLSLRRCVGRPRPAVWVGRFVAATEDDFALHAGAGAHPDGCRHWGVAQPGHRDTSALRRADLTYSQPHKQVWSWPASSTSIEGIKLTPEWYQVALASSIHERPGCVARRYQRGSPGWLLARWRETAPRCCRTQPPILRRWPAGRGRDRPCYRRQG
jgi:hypothetical protein